MPFSYMKRQKSEQRSYPIRNVKQGKQEQQQDIAIEFIQNINMEYNHMHLLRENLKLINVW